MFLGAGMVKICTTVSAVANVGLFVVKVVIAIQSGSLAMVASMLDSALDLLGAVIIFFIERSMQREDRFRYPQAHPYVPGCSS